MTISKENFALVKKDMSKSRLNPQTAKRILFAHQVSTITPGLSVYTIDLKNLTTPTEMLSNGFVQATQSEINGANLAIAKKNLRLVSSLKGPLIPWKHYIVADNYTITLINDLATALETGEIITGEIDSQIGDLVPASVRSRLKTVSVPVGQRQVNLGLEFNVGSNTTERVGDIAVYVRGGSVLYRNTGNSSTVLDGDYYEMDAGNGTGTNIMLNSSPTSAPLELYVDYGPVTVTNNDSLGTIQSIMGSVIKIAKDLAIVMGGSQTDYLNANPSDIERRTFGDSVLTLVGLNISSRLTTIESNINKTAYLSEQQPSGTNGGTSIAATWTNRILNTILDSAGVVSSLSSNQFLLQVGTYRITGTSQFSNSNNVKLRIRNITDGVTLVVGQSQIGNVTTGFVPGIIDGEFTLISPKLVSLQYYVQASSSVTGLGQAVSSGEVEVYTQLAITKIR